MKRIILNFILSIISITTLASDNLGLVRIYNSFSNTIPLYYSVDNTNWVELLGYQTKNLAQDDSGNGWHPLIIKNTFNLKSADGKLALNIIDTHQYLNNQLIVTTEAISKDDTDKRCWLLKPHQDIGSYQKPVDFNVIIYQYPNTQFFLDDQTMGVPAIVNILINDPICAKFFPNSKIIKHKGVNHRN